MQGLLRISSTAMFNQASGEYYSVFTVRLLDTKS
jgi:hypothetical protein